MTAAIARPDDQPAPQRWAILASHATKGDPIRFVTYPGTEDVITFASEDDARRDLDQMDADRKAGRSTRWAGFNLYAQPLTGGEA